MGIQLIPSVKCFCRDLDYFGENKYVVGMRSLGVNCRNTFNFIIAYQA